MQHIESTNLARARKIERHLRPPTLPVGIKFWTEGDRIPPEAGKRPEAKHTWCQFVSNARFNGSDQRELLLVKKEDILCHAAVGVLGFEEWAEEILDGRFFERIHFATKELAASAMKTIPRMPVGTQAITIGPLEGFPLEPDVVVIGVTPGRTNKVMDGAMWYKGGSFTTQYGNGCGICANATVEALVSPDKVAVIAFPCHGARRWGGWRDDELGCGVRIDQFDTWIEGMEGTFRSGHSYPVAHQLASPVKETHHPMTETPYEELYPYCLER
jgi:uncharacterized protein (DUF169 family)